MQAQRVFAPEDDGRGRYPAAVKVDVPRDWPDRVRAAARARGTTVAALVRGAIETVIANDTTSTRATEG